MTRSNPAGDSPALSARDDAEAHARRILDAVRRGVQAASGEALADSWTRCLHQHRLHPGRPRRPSVVSAADLARRQHALADVIAGARHPMAALHRQLADAEAAVVLTDTDGVIVHLQASDALAHAVAPIGLHVGAVWSEAEAGTNGMGTCLVAAEPVAVRCDDHFFTRLTSLSCAAVPLVDPHGRMVAVLDVTSRSHQAPQQVPLLLALLEQAAQSIENTVLGSRWPAARLLHFHPLADGVHTPAEGLLAIDADGRIVAGNRSALRLLGLRSAEALRTRRVPDLLHADADALAARCAAQGGRPVATAAPDGSGAFHVALTAAAVDTAAGRVATAPACGPSAALVLADAALAQAIDHARRALDRGVPVLLHGSTGTGKTAIAQALHATGRRPGGAQVTLHCGGLTIAALDAALPEAMPSGTPGHGATGAHARRAIEAGGSSLLLDDIGELAPALQARLLHLLDTRGERPGALRVVSTSPLPPSQLVADGRLRDDLAHRLCGFEVQLPPLHERADRMALADALLAEASQGRARLDRRAQAVIDAHPWPGNVRQLGHALRTALALADPGDTVTAEHLLAWQRCATPAGAPHDAPADRATSRDNPRAARPSLSNADPRQHLLQLLQDHRWNVSQVAKALDVSRNTLYRKLHALGIALSSDVRSDVRR